MSFVTIFLCFIFSCGYVQAQTIQERVNTAYSPWDVSAFSLISSESDQIHSGGMLNSYNFIGPNYRIDREQRLALKMAFVANTNGYDRFNGTCGQTQNSEFADPFVEYNHYNVGLLPGIADVFWSGRIFFPVSRSSRDKNMIARYRSNTIITRFFTKRLLGEFRNDINFYHQSASTYVGSHTDDNCERQQNGGPSNTKMARMENWVSLWYRVSRNLSLGGSALIRDEFFNGSDYSTSRQRNGRMHEISAMIGPSLRYTYSRNLNFIVSFRDRIEYSGFHPDRRDDLAEFAEFRSRNTELSLLSFIRF